MLQAYNETQKGIYESLLEGYTPSENATSEQTTGETPANTTNTGGTVTPTGTTGSSTEPPTTGGGSNPEIPIVAPAGEPSTGG